MTLPFQLNFLIGQTSYICSNIPWENVSPTKIIRMLVLPQQLFQDGLLCTLIYIYIYIYVCVCVSVCVCVRVCVITPSSQMIVSPCGWSCRMHWLHLCRGYDPHPANECLRNDYKQSNSEAPVILDLWGMWSIPSLLLLSGPFWSGVRSPESSYQRVK